jgi:hypothetical protein
MLEHKDVVVGLEVLAHLTKVSFVFLKCAMKGWGMIPLCLIAYDILCEAGHVALLRVMIARF